MHTIFDLGSSTLYETEAVDKIICWRVSPRITLLKSWVLKRTTLQRYVHKTKAGAIDRVSLNN